MRTPIIFLQFLNIFWHERRELLNKIAILCSPAFNFIDVLKGFSFSSTNNLKFSLPFIDLSASNSLEKKNISRKSS